MSPATADAVTILLVEPDPDDARLLAESFDGATVACDVHTVTDGETALDFVHQRGAHADSPRPDMTLLDFRLPDVDGADVLSELTSDPGLRSIPVIVMTGSASKEDIARSYDRHANAVVQKPVGPEAVGEFGRSFEEFWFTFVRLPGDGS